MTNEIALLPAQEMLKRFRAGELSPVEVLEATLSQVDRLDGQLNAFVTLDASGARLAARESEKRWKAGEPTGPLDGVPVSIKDSVLTRGMPSRKGSRTVSKNQRWDEDAPSSARLRAAGAILFGKTTLPEFGWKGVTDSPLSGVTRNPWNPRKTPGGSTGGGAAAVATGMGALTVGTDGGGSIRIPAGFTGVFGHKPTFGLVAAYPASPFGLISHTGPLSRTVGDAALMLDVIGHPDPRDPYCLPEREWSFEATAETGVRGLKAAFSPRLRTHKVDPEVARLVEAAVKRLEGLGLAVEAVDPPIGDCSETFRHHWYGAAAKLVGGFSREEQAAIDPGLLEIAEVGARYTLPEYLQAMAERERLSASMAGFHQRYDLLLTPCLPLPAFDAGIEYPNETGYRRWIDWTPFTYPFNLTQQPAASVPCGLTRQGLPAGLQIVAARHRDDLVLRAARAFEREAPFKLPET